MTRASDLVKRLRGTGDHIYADCIESQEEQIRRLREALGALACLACRQVAARIRALKGET